MGLKETTKIKEVFKALSVLGAPLAHQSLAHWDTTSVFFVPFASEFSGNPQSISLFALLRNLNLDEAYFHLMSSYQPQDASAYSHNSMDTYLFHSSHELPAVSSFAVLQEELSTVTPFCIFS